MLSIVLIVKLNDLPPFAQFSPLPYFLCFCLQPWHTNTPRLPPKAFDPDTTPGMARGSHRVIEKGGKGGRTPYYVLWITLTPSVESSSPPFRCPFDRPGGTLHKVPSRVNSINQCKRHLWKGIRNVAPLPLMVGVTEYARRQRVESTPRVTVTQSCAQCSILASLPICTIQPSCINGMDLQTSFLCIWLLIRANRSLMEPLWNNVIYKRVENTQICNSNFCGKFIF